MGSNPTCGTKGGLISIKKITYIGLSIALVFIATMIIQIPTPGIGGYIHLGDSAILLVSSIFGGPIGFIVAALGSSLSDIVTGYSIWAPFTFVIKCLMGFVMGIFSFNTTSFFKKIVGSLLSIVIMVVGYFLAQAFLAGSIAAGLAEVPWNIVQGVCGVALYLVADNLIEKIGLKKRINI